MEQELESDLAEVHRLIPLTNSPLVRDRLHTLLDELLQVRDAYTREEQLLH